MVFLMLLWVGELSKSLTGADAADSTPRPSGLANRSAQRTGQLVAVILGCIIIPAGIIALLYLLISYCLKRTKASTHRSKSSKADDEDDNRNWSDYSDSEEEKREISTFYMYVDPGDGITQDLNGNLKTIEANI